MSNTAVEEIPIHRIPGALLDQRNRPVFHIGQYVGRDILVIVDDLPLGKATLRIHDLVEIGEDERFTVDVCRMRSHSLSLQFRRSGASPDMHEALTSYHRQHRAGERSRAAMRSACTDLFCGSESDPTTF